MNQTTELNKIFHKFDCYCKKSLKGFTRNLKRDRERIYKYEVSLNCLLDNETSDLLYFDRYPSLSSPFTVSDYVVDIINDSLETAIGLLSQEKRTVILLYYFYDMGDKEIAKLLGCTRENICIKRNLALKELKMYIERLRNDD